MYVRRRECNVRLCGCMGMMTFLYLSRNTSAGSAVNINATVVIFVVFVNNFVCFLCIASFIVVPIVCNCDLCVVSTNNL